MVNLPCYTCGTPVLTTYTITNKGKTREKTGYLYCKKCETMTAFGKPGHIIWFDDLEHLYKEYRRNKLKKARKK